MFKSFYAIKFLFIASLLSFLFLYSGAQNDNRIIAKSLLEKHQVELGLSNEDMNNCIITDSYLDQVSGIRMVYVQQSYLDIPLYNQLQVLAFKNDQLVSTSGKRITGVEKITNGVKGIPVINAETAVLRALQDRKIKYSRNPIVTGSEKNGHFITFDDMDVSQKNITAELMWVPLQDGKKIVLAWQIYIVPVNSSDYWMVRVNAIDNTIVGVNNFTVYCNWDGNAEKQTNAPNKKQSVTKKKIYGDLLFDFQEIKKPATIPLSPSIINNATYRVISYPAESPKHTGGTPALVTDPWTAAPGNATSLKWHSTGTSDYSSSRGNNVWAQEDRDGNNGTGLSAISITTANPLSFDFTPSFTVDPIQTTPTPNQQFNITNLFYWNNIIHDLSYLYGFDEVSGNFQSNNQSRGGIGNDYVLADAQDGSGSQNANFSTPPDGSNGRMQMFLWPQTGSAVDKDGDVDNGVISHEFAHGISNRLTGGPSLAGCLSNAEQMGEGWSDYYGLMYTQNWATSTLTSGTAGRSVGTYVMGQSPSGAGLRTKKYSTNFNLNSTLVYASTIDAESHNRGEIWCATLWDMTWNIINQVGYITSNLYNADSSGGNVIALKLVTLGMKLQPCSPGFIDGRDAILQADQILYNGEYACAIREAFRRRGMGAFATQGSSESVTDQVPDYNSGNATLSLSESATQIPEGQNITYTNKIVVGNCGNLTNFLLTDTLPSNVTYVSGGTYNSTNRVVSFPVSINAGQTQLYAFTVKVNTGSYFPTVSLFEDNVNSTTVTPIWTKSSTLASTNWEVSTARSYSPNKSYFSKNIDSINDEKLTLNTAIALGATPPPLSFRHWYNTESTYDGGVLEITTDNGVTWSDMQANITAGNYNALMDTSTILKRRRAWTGGTSNKFIKTKVNLTPYANKNIKLRFRFVTDLGTAYEGWYVDDIAIKSQAVVEMQSNLYNSSNVGVLSTDTIAIIQTACSPIMINTDPTNVNVCSNSNAAFTVGASGLNPTYVWQVKTTGNPNFTNINGATSATLSLNAVGLGLNNNQYRVIVSNSCPSSDTSAIATLTVSSPAAITSQPVSKAECVGSSVTFSVTASGTANTYQWQVKKNGEAIYNNIPGATGSSLVLSNISDTMNNNMYHVIIYSCAPSITSANVSLYVYSPASIASDLSGTTVCKETNASFSANAIGSNLEYAWQMSTDGGQSFSTVGSNNNILSIPNTPLSSNNYEYRYIVSSTACPGPDTSNWAILHVSDDAFIETEPVNDSVCFGSNGLFHTAAIGAGLQYQWQVKDTGNSFHDIIGENSDSLILNNVNNNTAQNLYRVLITNTCSVNTLISDTVQLYVFTAPTITSHPSDVLKCEGSDVSFTTAITGTDNQYQWQISTDGGISYSDLTGQSNLTLNIANINSVMNNNKYRLLLSDQHCGQLFSNAATLHVSDSARILQQGHDIKICSENDTLLSVQALGSSLTYQWQISSNNGNSFIDSVGATNDTLLLNQVAAYMNGYQFRVIVQEATCGNEVSIIDTLTVYPSPQASLVAGSGQPITLSANTDATSGTFYWYLNNTILSGQTGNSIPVSGNSGGIYFFTVTDQNSCTVKSNEVVIKDSSVNTPFIYPNPSNGEFKIVLNNIIDNNSSRIVAVFDAKGSRVFTKQFENIASNSIDISLRNIAEGIYTIAVFDSKGKITQSGKIIIR